MGCENDFRITDQFFKTIAETTTSSIFITKERYIYVNPAFERLTGYSFDELKKMKFYEIVHPEHRELVKQRGMARLKGQSPPKNYTFKILSKDGRTRWVDFSADIINLHGEPAIIGTAYDITAIKEIQEKLIHAKKQWEQTFDAISDFVSIHDKDFNILRVNRAFANKFGLKFSEIIGKKCYELIHGTSEPLPECPHKIAIETRQPCTKEVPYNGIKGTLLVTVSPIFDEEGNFIGSVHFAKDITELKEIQMEVAKRAEELRAIHEITSQIQKSLDIDSVIETVLAEMKKILKADLSLFFLVERDRLVLKGQLGGISPIAQKELSIGECLCGMAIKEKDIIISKDIHNDVRCTLTECKQQKMVSFIGIPLIREDVPLGILGLGWKKKEHLEDKMQLIETLAGELTLMLHNALLYSQVKNHAEELEKKVRERTEELQKMVNLMAGREIRMAELKETIQKLRRQLLDAGITPIADDPLKE